MLTPAEGAKFQVLLHTAHDNCLRYDTVDKAISAADQALKIAPNNPEALCIKGSALMTKEEDQAALQCFDLAYNAYPQAYPLQGKANCLLKLKRKDEALACIDQALKLEPTTEGRKLRAKILLQFNRWQEAKHDLDLVIAEREKEKNRDRLYLLFPRADRADIEMHLKQWAGALDDLNYCLNDPKLQIQQGNYEQILKRGQVYKELKQYDKAIADYKWALKINPDFRQTHLGLAEVYSAAGKEDLAKAEMKIVAELDQDLAPIK